MLVLSRRKKQSICIGGRLVRITVLGVSGGRVRLGIDAPKEWTVNREEVEDAIEQQRKREEGWG